MNHPWVVDGALSTRAKRQLSRLSALRAVADDRYVGLNRNITQTFINEPTIACTPDWKPGSTMKTYEYFRRRLYLNVIWSSRDCPEHKIYVSPPNHPICVFSRDPQSLPIINVGSPVIATLREAENSLHKNQASDEVLRRQRMVAELGGAGLFAAALTAVEHAALQPHPIISGVVAAASLGSAYVVNRLRTRFGYGGSVEQLHDLLDAAYDTLKHDAATLDLNTISTKDQSVMNGRLERSNLNPSFYSSRLFLIDLALGIITIDGTPTPLSNEQLDTCVVPLESFIRAFNEYRAAADAYGTAEENHLSRRQAGIDTRHDNMCKLQELRQRTNILRSEAMKSFYNLVTGVEVGVAAQREEEQRHRFRQALDSKIIEPVYTSSVCQTIQSVAFTAIVNNLFSADSTEHAERVLQQVHDWLTKASAATDELADTSSYYSAFYRRFRRELPGLPAPEEFKQNYPHIAAGLDR